MHIQILHNVRVVRSSASQIANTAEPSTSSPTTVMLSNGTSETTDLYIDATGGIPNSQFLPKEWLDDSKRVLTRDAYFRVKGGAINNNDDDATGVYVLGDMVAGSANTVFELDAMIPTMCSAIGIDIAEQITTLAQQQPGSNNKKMPNRAVNVNRNPGLLGTLWAMIFGSRKSSGMTTLAQKEKEKEFKPLKDTIVVPIGRDGGVGQLLGWKMPSLLVRITKGKSYLIEQVDPMLSGSKWKL